MSKDLSLLRILQILALKSVEQPTYDDWYRGICRWYSREFNTPLLDVYDMSEEEVLKTHFEDNLHALYNKDDENSAQAYDRVREDILSVDVNRAKEIDQANADDDEWYRKEVEQAEKDHMLSLAKEKEKLTNPNLEDTESMKNMFVKGEERFEIPDEFEDEED